MAAVGALIYDFPELSPILGESLEDNEGQVLPHLVLADIVRWLASRVDSEPDRCELIVNWLERAYERGPEDVRGWIVVSGVEMIPDPGHPGSSLRELLGPILQGVDPWRDIPSDG